MYDTVAAITNVERELPLALFQGGTTTEFFNGDERQRAVRLWRNPEPGDDYAPRITYWPHDEADPSLGGWLKAEFSIPKMAAPRGDDGGYDLLGTVTDDARDLAFTRVDEYLAVFGDMPAIQCWSAQRIDYACNWNVGDLLPVYMSVFQKLRVANCTRHPFDAHEGVVWKSRSTKGRWIKFYNKRTELARSEQGAAMLLRQYDNLADVPGVLRFEVSNYKDAVRYMANSWFDCSRTVGELCQEGRALYVLSRFLSHMGLSASDEYGREELLLFRMREALGSRSMPSAWYALSLHRKYGNEAYGDELALIGKSAYYSQVSRLREHGFLAASDDADADEPLKGVVLMPENLAFLGPPQGGNSARKFSRENWADLAVLFGIPGVKRPLDDLVRMVNDDFGEGRTIPPTYAGWVEAARGGAVQAHALIDDYG